MEDFKIALGATLKDDVASSINAQIKGLHTEPIKLKIDTDSAKSKLKTIKKQIEGLSDIKVTLSTPTTGSKSGSKNQLPISPVDVTKLTQSLDKLNASLDGIQKSLGSLDDASGMQSILATINQVNASLSEMAKQFKSIEQMFNGTSFNLNFNLGLSGGKNPIANNALYSDKAKTDVIPQLRKQAEELARVVSEYYRQTDKYGGAAQLLFQVQSQLKGKIDVFDLLKRINDPDASLSKQMSALRQFINVMQEAAAIKGIDLSAVTSGFGKTADELVADAQKILSGEAQMEESMQKLQSIFGSGSKVNLDGVSEQIASIITKLDELNQIIKELSVNVSFDGLTESFRELSASIKQIVENCTIVRNSIATGLDGAETAAQDASNSFSSVATSAQNAASEINGITLRQTTQQINNMKTAMSDLGFDSSSIDVATQKIEDMNLTISKITTKMNADGSVRLTVVGTDELGRTVTAVRSVRQEIKELEDGTKQAETIIKDLGTTTSQSFNEMPKEVTEAYSKLLWIIKEIGSTQVKLAGLDPEKNAAEIESLRNRLNELQAAYSGISETFGSQFDESQTDGIEDAWKRVADAVVYAEAKMADASATKQMQAEARQVEEEFRKLLSISKQISNIELRIAGLDEEKNAHEIETLRTLLEGLRGSYEELMQSLQGKLSTDQLQQLVSETYKTEGELDALQSKKADASAEKQRRDEIQRTTEAYKELLTIIKQMGKLTLGIEGIDADKSVPEIEKLREQLAQLRERYSQIMDSFGQSFTEAQKQGITKAREEVGYNLDLLDAKLASAKAKLAEDITLSVQSGDLDRVLSDMALALSRIEIQSDETKNAFQEFTVASNALKSAVQGNDIDLIVAAQSRYKEALEKVNNQIRINTNAQRQANDVQRQSIADQKLIEGRQALSSSIDVWLKKNSAAVRQFGGQLETLKTQIETCDAIQLDRLEAEFKEIKRQAELAGVAGISFGDKLKKQLGNYGAYFSIASVFSYVEQALRSMYDNVVKIDAAMTELKKVTNETDDAYSNFLSNAGKEAQRLGTTLDGLITSTADFARLGYSFEESQELAKIANIYAVVGDEIESVEAATESLISTLTAFGGEVTAMEIVDKFNEVGNRFAITSGGIGEALQRSASSMAAAGNTLDETIALITAANTIAQNPEAVGTAFKTISMRIRAAKTELEEAGLETEGMAESTATLRKEILALSGVDIMIDENTFKSTYQILEELATKWQYLTDIQRASITELLAGKHHGNILSALLNNFDIAQEALMVSSEGSEGSAMTEHTRAMESLEAKIKSLQAAWQQLSQTFLNSDFLKAGIDALTGIVNALNAIVETLGTIGTISAGLSIFGTLKNGIKVGKLVSGLNEVGWSFDSLGAAAKAAGTNLMAFIKTPSGVMAGIGLAITAISTAIQIYENYKAEQERLRQEIIEDNNEILDAVDGFEQAYIKYSGKTRLTAEEEKELKSAIDGTVDALGDKAGVIQDVIDKNGDYIESLEDVANAEMTAAYAAAYEAATAAEASLKGKVAGFLGSNGASFSIGNDANLGKIYFVAQEIIPDYIEEQLYPDSNNPVNPYGLTGYQLALPDYENADADDIVEYYLSLIKLKEELKRRAADENDQSYITGYAYENLCEEITSLSEAVDEYLTQQYNLEKYDYMRTNGIPKTVEEYLAMRDAILGTIDASEEYKSAIAGMMDAEWTPVFGKGEIDRASAIRDIKSQHAAHMASFGVVDARAIEEFNAWIDNLTEEELEIVYRISISNSDEAREKMLDELKRLSRGGNVDLTVRPTVNTQDLENAGWEDVGEGVATVFTTTFSNEAAELGEDGGIAINFTPIVVDENGNVIDILSPEALETYASEVISGVREDDLGLQIGAVYEGADAIAKAEADAIRIHKLHEQYFLTPPISQWGLPDWQAALANYQVPETQKFAFSDLIADEDFMGDVDSYIEKMAALQDAYQAILDGDFTESGFIELIKIFPELASRVDDLDVAIVELAESMDADMVSHFSSQFGYMETDEDVAALNNLMNAVLELGQIVGDTQFSVNFSAESEGMDRLSDAIGESVSATGLATESIEALHKRYKDIDGYNPAKLFERTANGIHLNTKALRELEAAYVKQQKAKIDKDLENLYEEYNRLTNEINATSDAAKRAELYAQRNDIRDQIADTANLAAQYDGLTSAFYRWQLAQSQGEEGDMYDSVTGSLEGIKELYDKGLIGTNEFRAAVQLMTDVDLTNATPEELVAFYEAGYPKMTRYFTESHDGVLNFLHDVQKINSEWAHLNEDGSWTINFSPENDEAIAEALGVNVEIVQAIMRKLSDYGFDINLESAYTNFEQLATRAEEASDKLLELGLTTVEFNFDTTDLDSINEQIAEAERLLGTFRNEDGTFNVNAEGYEEVKLVYDTLLAIRQQLEPSDGTTVSASVDVDASELEYAIDLVAQLQTAIAEYEGALAIGADTKGAVRKIINLVLQLNRLSPEVKAELGLDDEEFSDALTTLEGTSINIDAELDPNSLAIIKNTMGAIKIDPISVSGSVAVDSSDIERAISLVETLNALVGIYETQLANGIDTTQVENAIDLVLGQMRGLDRQVWLTLGVNPDEFYTAIGSLTSNSVGTAIIDTTANFDGLKNDISTFTTNSVGTATVDTTASPDGFTNDISNLTSNSVGTATIDIGTKFNKASTLLMLNYELKKVKLPYLEAGVQIDHDDATEDAIGLISELNALVDQYLEDIKIGANTDDVESEINRILSEIQTVSPEVWLTLGVDPDELSDAIDEITGVSTSYGTAIVDVDANPELFNNAINNLVSGTYGAATVDVDANSELFNSVINALASGDYGTATVGTTANTDGFWGVINNLTSNFAEIVTVDTTAKFDKLQILKQITLSLQGITPPPVTVGTTVVADAVDDFVEAEHTASGVVRWSNIIKQVTSWASKLKESLGMVRWKNDTSEVMTHFDATGTIHWENSGGVAGVAGTATPPKKGGGGNRNGGGRYDNLGAGDGASTTFLGDIDSPFKNRWGFVNGTAYARGNWGTKDSGTALVGELGQELVVRDGRFFTIGDNGAEFFEYKKDDIIFNAEQTKQIFEKGKITTGQKRGKTFANGSAFVEGNAFKAGNLPLTTSVSGAWGSSGSGTIIVGGEVTTTPGGNNSGNSDNSGASDKDKDEFKETFDWIEVAIDRIERAISRLDLKVNSIYKTWSSRNKNLRKEISKIEEEIDLQRRGYERYLEQANSVGLEESWAEKVRNGEVNIEDITDEELANKIKEYQEW